MPLDTMQRGHQPEELGWEKLTGLWIRIVMLRHPLTPRDVEWRGIAYGEVAKYYETTTAGRND